MNPNLFALWASMNPPTSITVSAKATVMQDNLRDELKNLLIIIQAYEEHGFQSSADTQVYADARVKARALALKLRNVPTEC